MYQADCVGFQSFQTVNPLLAKAGVVFAGGTVSLNGATVPAISATWPPFTDPYVYELDFEYQRAGLSDGAVQGSARADALSWVGTNGLVANGTYLARYRSVGEQPGVWSDPQVVVVGALTASSALSVPGFATIGTAQLERTIDEMLEQLDAAGKDLDAKIAAAYALFGSDDNDLNAESIIQLADRVRGLDQRISSLFDGRPPGPFMSEVSTTTAISASTLQVMGYALPNGGGFVFNDTQVSFSDGTLFSSYRQGVSTSLGTLSGAVTSEQSSRIQGDSVLSSSISAVSAKSDTNAAAIVNEQYARISADSAEAQSRLSLATQVGQNSSDIQNNYISLTNSISTEATARLSLQSSYNGFVSSANQQFLTLSNQYQSLSNYSVNLNSDYQGFKSSASSQLSTLAQNGSGYASSIQSLTASYNSLSGTVSTQSSVLYNLNNQFIGAWKVSVQSSVAGYTNVIAGLDLIGSSGPGGTFSAFRVLADNVLFVGSDGSAARFLLAGGSMLQIDRLIVKTLNIAGGAVTKSYFFANEVSFTPAQTSSGTTVGTGGGGGSGGGGGGTTSTTGSTNSGGGRLQAF